MKATITIPQDWSDITIKTYKAIQSIRSTGSVKDVFKRTAILCNTDLDTVMKIKSIDLMKILDSLSWIDKDPLTDSVSWTSPDGQLFAIEDDISGYVLEKLESLTVDPQKDIHIIASVLCRPAKMVEGVIEVEDYDPKTVDERAVYFNEILPITVACTCITKIPTLKK